MIRTAAAIRQSLDETLPGTQATRHGKALLLRYHLLMMHDRYKANRCRSVREKQQHDTRETDGLPAWL